jgi:sarcosine oxidase subunit alpha
MVIEGQNAWPSLEHDFYSVFDRLNFLLPAGFQYKRFIRPRFLWPIAEKLIRRMAGLGKLSRTGLTEHSKPTEELSPDVLVVGGGPAGLNAALNAGKLRANTILIDDGPELGGRFRLQTSHVTFPPWEGLRGFQACERLSDELSHLESVKVYLNSTVLGHYLENLWTAETPHHYLVLKPKKTVIATGCYDRPLVFPNNDLPGIFLPLGILRLMHDYGVLPGRKSVVVTNNHFGYEVADSMRDSGIEVNAICDERQEPNTSTQRVGLILSESTITEAVGGKSLSGVRIKTSHEVESIPCDVLCVASGITPSNELLFQLGCDMKYSSTVGGHIPNRDSHMLATNNCYAVGAAAGTLDLHSASLEGAIASAAACHSLGIEKERAASIIHGTITELDRIREARAR